MIHPDDLPEALRDELLGRITPEMQAKQDAARERVHARLAAIQAEAARREKAGIDSTDALAVLQAEAEVRGQGDASR